MTPHPDDAVLAEYAQGGLQNASLAALEAHVASCGDCREVIAGLIQVVAAPETRGPKKGLVLGRYVVLDPVGSGALGEVFSAYDSTLERTVALKWLYPSVRSPTARACAPGSSPRRAPWRRCSTPTWWWCTTSSPTTRPTSS
jgi:hypothetical protein